MAKGSFCPSLAKWKRRRPFSAIRLASVTHPPMYRHLAQEFYALFEGAAGALPAVGNNLGGDHLDPQPFGSDLLPTIASGGISGGSGLDIPLREGTYTYLIQQTGPQVSDHLLDFQVIPEPSSAGCCVWA